MNNYQQQLAGYLGSKPRSLRSAMTAIFGVLTESQQARALLALGIKEAAREAQEATQARDDEVRGALEAAHIAQWIELSARAESFGVKLWLDGGAGFGIQVDGDGMWKRCDTLFELRAALSDYVAHERAQGREPKPNRLAELNEHSHAAVRRWEELKVRATDHSLDLRAEPDGFYIGPEASEESEGPLDSLADLGAALESLVADLQAAQRDMLRDPNATIVFRKIDPMTPEEAAAWKKRHPGRARELEEQITVWKQLFPDLFREGQQ